MCAPESLESARRCTSGHATNSPGSLYRKATRSSRRSSQILLIEKIKFASDSALVTIVYQYSRAEADLEESARPPTGFPPSPYKGLEAFYEEDADRFFGRRALVETLE